MAEVIVPFQRKFAPRKFTAVERQNLHSSLDYILDHGQHSLRYDLADHAAQFIGLFYDRLKKEVKTVSGLQGGITTSYPGISIHASILKRLGLNRSVHSSGYIRWKSPNAKNGFTPVFEIGFSDFEASWLGPRTAYFEFAGITNANRLAHQTIEIDLVSTVPRFTCPFPKRSKEWDGRCHAKVTALFLPFGADVLGCASCYGLTKQATSTFWDSFELTIDPNS